MNQQHTSDGEERRPTDERRSTEKSDERTALEGAAGDSTDASPTVERILDDVEALRPAERRALLARLGVSPDDESVDPEDPAPAEDEDDDEDEAAAVERLWEEYYERHPEDPLARQVLGRTPPAASPTSNPADGEAEHYARRLGDLLDDGGGCAETWGALAAYRDE